MSTQEIYTSTTEEATSGQNLGIYQREAPPECNKEFADRDRAIADMMFMQTMVESRIMTRDISKNRSSAIDISFKALLPYEQLLSMRNFSRCLQRSYDSRRSPSPTSIPAEAGMLRNNDEYNQR